MENAQQIFMYTLRFLAPSLNKNIILNVISGAVLTLLLVFWEKICFWFGEIIKKWKMFRFLYKNKKQAKKYVVTEDMKNAYTQFRKNGIIVILGDEGIGKTCLAKWLILRSGTKKIKITDLVSLQLAKNTTYFLDDFLGETHSEFRQEDIKSYKTFAQNIQNAIQNQAKFIFTSRTYIIEDTSFSPENTFSKYLTENVFTITHPSRLERLKILKYTCIKYQIKKNVAMKLGENNFYLKILRHKNYNNRLVEDIIKTLTDKNYQDFSDRLITGLDTPKYIYEQCFSALTQEQKTLLFIIYMYYEPRSILLNFATNELWDCAKNYYDNRTTFKQDINKLEEYFLLYDKGHKFVNPTVKDFVSKKIQSNTQAVFNIMGKVNRLPANFSIIAIWSSTSEKVQENLSLTLERILQEDNPHQMSLLNAPKIITKLDQNKNLRHTIIKKTYEKKKINFDKLLCKKQNEKAKFCAECKNTYLEIVMSLDAQDFEPIILEGLTQPNYNLYAGFILEDDAAIDHIEKLDWKSVFCSLDKYSREEFINNFNLAKDTNPTYFDILNLDCYDLEILHDEMIEEEEIELMETSQPDDVSENITTPPIDEKNESETNESETNEFQAEFADYPNL